MKHRCSVLAIIAFGLIAFVSGDFLIVQAHPADSWWHEDWPYRVAVQASAPGPASVHLDFTALFSELGLADALLDIRSIRVVPVVSGTSGDPAPYQETYTTSLYAGEALATSPTPNQPYWGSDPQVTLSLSSQKFTEGSHSLQVVMDYVTANGAFPDFIYHFNGASLADWSRYETLIYDLWPEVNESALDQAPDLYQFELLGLQNCSSRAINGPALALGHWNQTTVSLAPFGNCPEPDPSALSGLRFYFLADLYEDAGNYAAGDKVTLWLDDFRLVDQDGPGEIRWNAEEGVETYYIYFDTINHAGHESPTLADIPGEAQEAAIAGAPEAGSYFHQIEGVSSAGLTLWTAPTTEKILRTQKAPNPIGPLAIQAAKGESEAFQLVVQSPGEQSLPVSVSDLRSESAVIPASAIQIYRVDYVPLTQLSDSFGRLTEWPDPLSPLRQGELVAFPAGVNQPLWFRVDVPAGIPAGDYQGIIQIGTATAPLSLEVWDFTLPESALLPFSAGLDPEALLEAYGGTLAGVPQPCSADLNAAIAETLAAYHITPLAPETEPAGLIYSLTAYPQTEAQAAKAQSEAPLWWRFTAYDDPPFANPAVLDRTGQEARILPWMAWYNAIDGLYYHQLADWDSDPWEAPFTNYLSNGDGTLFYPPRDGTVGYDPCDPGSNRLIPSIRLELLREGLEDAAYLQMLSGKPSLSAPSKLSQQFPSDQDLASRAFTPQPPTLFTAMRAELAREIMAKSTTIFIPLFAR